MAAEEAVQRGCLARNSRASPSPHARTAPAAPRADHQSGSLPAALQHSWAPDNDDAPEAQKPIPNRRLSGAAAEGTPAVILTRVTIGEEDTKRIVEDGMRTKKLVVGLAAGAAAIFLSAVPAGASHVHSLQTGSGACVLLAQSGGEKNVQLPFADELAANRRHPLHVLVHTGEVGQHLSIGVVATTSDPCLASGRYLNKR